MVNKLKGLNMNIVIIFLYLQIIISITINILLFIWHNALIYPGGFEQLEKDFEAAYK